MPVATATDDHTLTCLVVADHQLCGQAVGGLISQQFGLGLAVVCSSVSTALMVMEQQCAPGLLLLDVSQPTESWRDAAAALVRLNPDGRMILLLDQRERFQAPTELSRNLLGVIDKSCSWNDLIALVSQWLQQHPSPAYRRRTSALMQLNRLSPRELRVFEALGRGMHNKDIARTLTLKISTVETYRKLISAKLGLSGVELVQAAALHLCTQSASL